MTERDLNNEEKGYRPEAIHMRGTDDMNTDEVFQYFSEFPAKYVEWINDTSCKQFEYCNLVNQGL